VTVDPILTLEPLMEAIQAGVETAGWTLSGMQKTTSHQFEGRWEGESTRSAYLFFHPTEGPEWVSVDVYLDETGRGLSGNLALVVDIVPLERLGATEDVLASLAAASLRHLPDRQRRPVTLRYRLADAGDEIGSAETEVRFKISLPRKLMEAGAPSVAAFTSEVVRAFGDVLRSSEVTRYAPDDEDEPEPWEGAG
jgi:hypothetical protein